MSSASRGQLCIVVFVGDGIDYDVTDKKVCKLAMEEEGMEKENV